MCMDYTSNKYNQHFKYQLMQVKKLKIIEQFITLKYFRLKS